MLSKQALEVQDVVIQANIEHRELENEKDDDGRHEEPHRKTSRGRYRLHGRLALSFILFGKHLHGLGDAPRFLTHLKCIQEVLREGRPRPRTPRTWFPHDGWQLPPTPCVG